MHDIEAKLAPICEMKHTLVEWSEEHINQGKECVNTEELGEVVDMIKDLAETEEKCWKAEYYKSIVEAMKEAKEDDEAMDRLSRLSGMMGYNSNRSARTGRYTSGRGGRRGYPMDIPMPYPYMDEDELKAIRGEMDPWFMTEMDRMGYPMGDSRGSSRAGRMTRTQSGTRMGVRSGYTDDDYDEYGNRREDMSERYREWDPKHSRAYNEYRLARRHYTKTNSPEDREEMRTHANQHVMESIATIRDIWDGADTDLKKRMKQDFTSLLEEMKV